MRGLRSLLPVLGAVLLLTSAAPAPPPGPLIGDRARPLDVTEWLAGGPFALPAPGQVIVLDVWAPWCGPCIGGFAHLSELQDRYRDQGVVIVGLSGVDDYGSTLEKARDVVAKRRDQIRYRMAWDDGRNTFWSWMGREQSSGWPWCWVVDREGRIAWTGHPSGLDPVLERVVAGTWNRDSMAVVYRHRATGLDLSHAFYEAYHDGRGAEARSDYAALRAFDPAYAADYAPHYFKLLLVRENRPADAYAFARAALDTMLRERPNELRRIAEVVPDTTTPPAARDLDVALECAKRSAATGLPNDAAPYATLARVHALRGEWDAAVRAQEHALEVVDTGGKAEFTAALARYRAHMR